jgi:sugar phosphate isomerase/epimerase
MFGISTFCLHSESLPEALDRITGITNYIEVMDEGRHFLGSAELLESYSARFTLHAPCRSVNIACLFEPIRKASVEVTGEAFAIASVIGASVVIHPGYFTWPEERERAEGQCRQSLRELREAADEYGIRFFVENMADWEYFFLKTPEELPLIGDCGFALDVGHANQNRCLDGFLGCRVGHFHLHDNNGSGDTHSAVGEGTIDFRPVMAKVRESGVVPVIEVATFEGTVASIAKLDRL